MTLPYDQVTGAEPILAALRAHIAEAGTVKGVARQIGIKSPSLHHMLSGKLLPSARVASFYGFERRLDVSFKEIEGL